MRPLLNAVAALAVVFVLLHSLLSVSALSRHPRLPSSAPADAAAAFSSASPRVAPHSLRIEQLSVSTHPVDLVVDTAHPLLSWQLADEADQPRGLSQTAYRLQLLQHSPRGQYVQCGSSCDTGRVNSTRSHGVHHPLTLAPNARYVLRVKYWASSGRESDWAEAAFRTSMLDEWRAAPGQWIGSRLIPMHQLRKEVSLPDRAIAAATVLMSGIGYSALHINGRAVDPSRVLDPGWTTFQRRTLYVSLAVESFLQAGSNALAVELGNGWYSQEQYMVGQQEPSYGPPRLWLWLRVQFADNSSVDVTSDETWLGSTGPTLHDGVYMGSVVDHQWVRPGWTQPNFHDRTSLWINASVLPSPLDKNGVLALQTMDPIRLPPYNLHVATSGDRSNPPGVQGGDLAAQRGGIIQPEALIFGVNAFDVSGQPYDLGQNMAGWCELRMAGRRGSSVMVRYTETLELPGPQTLTMLYSDNLQNAAATDIFIFAEDDVLETFVPSFTIHGFRYLEVRGARNTITADNVTCYFVHSEVTLIGNLTFDNRVMNQLQHNLQWGQLSNLQSIPSDCPQRDERKGWLGDAGISADESLYNFDSGLFYHNFLDLIHDVQAADGSIPDTVPFSYGTRHADPNWGTAYPTIASAVYDHTGDVRVLQKHFAGMKAWVEYVRGQWADGGLQGIGYSYGDWIPPAPYSQTNPHLIASFPFLMDVQRVLRAATLVNDSATAKDYTQLYSRLVADFNALFYNNQTHQYADGSQAANALALALPGVVPPNDVDAVVASLVANITALGHHTCGVTSVSQLFPMLSTHGHHDLALTLAQQTSYPSYGWMFTNEIENATTLWERWDSPRESPYSNSRNHIMYGSIGAWLYRYVAGVELSGMEALTIRPRMATDWRLMRRMQAEVVTVKGAVAVAYDRSGEQGAVVELTVAVPANTRATVVLEPAVQGTACLAIWESGHLVYERNSRGALDAVEGVAAASVEAGTGAISIGVEHGRYRFRAQWG